MAAGPQDGIKVEQTGQPFLPENQTTIPTSLCSIWGQTSHVSIDWTRHCTYCLNDYSSGKAWWDFRLYWSEALGKLPPQRPGGNISCPVLLCLMSTCPVQHICSDSSSPIKQEMKIAKKLQKWLFEMKWYVSVGWPTWNLGRHFFSK